MLHHRIMLKTCIKSLHSAIPKPYNVFFTWPVLEILKSPRTRTRTGTGLPTLRTGPQSFSVRSWSGPRSLRGPRTGPRNTSYCCVTGMFLVALWFYVMYVPYIEACVRSVDGMSAMVWSGLE